MRNKFFVIIVIAALLVCNVIALYALQVKKQEMQVVLDTLYPYAVKSDLLVQMTRQNARFGHDKLKDLPIFDLRKNELKVSDLFSSEDSLLFVLRISDRFCNTCVEYCVDLLDSLQSNNDNSVVYLLESNNFNTFEKNAKDYGILGKRIFKTAFLECSIDMVEVPYVMVLNRNLQIEQCYFPQKGNFKVDSENIQLMIEIYKKHLQRMYYPS